MSGMSRRTALKIATVSAASMAGIGATRRLGTVGRPQANPTARRTVNVVDAGAANDGSERIDDVLASIAADDTTIEFPPGTYKLGTFRPGPLSNFTLSGTDATLVPPAGSTDIIVGLLGQHVTVEGFTFDYTAPNTAPQVIVRCSHGLTIRDCRFDGVADVWGGRGRSNHEYHLMPAVTHPDGTGVVRNVSLADGSTSPSNRGGIWVSGESAGTLRFEDVVLRRWANNSLYVDRSDGTVVVSGARFVNNGVSGPRLGMANARVENTTVISDGQVPVQGFTGDQKSRGLWVDDQCQQVRVEDCRFVMTGPHASDAIVYEDWSGSGSSGTASGGVVDRTVGQTYLHLVDDRFVLRPDLDVIRRVADGATVVEKRVKVVERA